MKTEYIIVTNIKCNGCATTIQNELLKLNGVLRAEAFKEMDMVKMTCMDTISHDVIVKRLHELWYPEATKKNGLLL